MGARITWAPIGETATQYVDLSDYGLQRLASNTRSNAKLVVAPSGYAATIYHDIWTEFELHVDGIDKASDGATWRMLQIFCCHAEVSQEFEFAVESSKTYSNQLNGSHANGSTVLTVDSTTGLSSGDTIWVEHLTDPRRMSCALTGPPTSTQFNITPALVMDFVDNSPVYHFQYHEKCRAKAGAVKFTERDAGLGANLWDFRMKFRSYRG